MATPHFGADEGTLKIILDRGTISVTQAGEEESKHSDAGAGAGQGQAPTLYSAVTPHLNAQQTFKISFSGTLKQKMICFMNINIKVMNEKPS
jgi:hypothetical protein